MLIGERFIGLLSNMQTLITFMESKMPQKRKLYWFWIKRVHGQVPEKYATYATDPFEAVGKLPKCVSWDFMFVGGTKTGE